MDREKIRHVLRYLLIIPLALAIYISFNMGGFLGISLGTILVIYSVLVLFNLWTDKLNEVLEWFQILVIIGFLIYALSKRNWIISALFLLVALRQIYVNVKDRVLIVGD